MYFFSRLVSHAVLLCALISVALGHGDHSGDRDPKLFEVMSVERFEDRVAQALEHSIRFGGGVSTTLEERELGVQLLDAVYDEVIAGLKKQGSPSSVRIAGERIRRFISGFNPVKIGRWLIDTGRRHGPALAVAFGMTELTENVGMLYATKYHDLMFLVPLYFLHVPDLMAFSLTLGLPRLMRTAKLWRRFGGLIQGPGAYYRHLLMQRQVLPIDWGEVIDVSTLASVEATNEAAAELKFAIIEEGWLARRLPRALRIVFSPRKLAQRETVPTFSIHELERIAVGGGADVRMFRGFKASPRLYAAILLREISLSEESVKSFSKAVRERNFYSAEMWARVKSVDSRALAGANDADELERAARGVGEDPDLIAQRLLWMFRQKRDALFDSLDKQSKKIRKSQRKYFRRLAKLLDQDSGLARLAAANVEEPADWRALYQALDETRSLVVLIEAERDAFPPPPSKPDVHDHAGGDHDHEDEGHDHRGLQRCQELLSRG